MIQNSTKQHSDNARQQIENMSMFINNLLDFLHGANPNIDHELSRLKQVLSGKPDYASAAELSLKAKSKLINEHQLKEQRNFEALNEIQASLQSLYELDSITSATKAEIKAFLESNRPTDDKPGSPATQIEQALKILRKALSHTKLTPDQLTASTHQDIHERISEELRELLSPYAAKQPQSEMFFKLQAKLEAGLEQDDLLDCCLSMIRFVIKDMVTEANSANNLIHDIHTGIGNVSSGVNSTIKHSKQRLEARTAHSDELSQGISAIEHAVEDTEEIEDLKRQTKTVLGKMQASISAAVDEEQQEQAKMFALLEAMHARLNQLESKAQRYKQKLIDQRINAMTDTLTQLPNRMAYEEKIKAAFESAKHSSGKLCIAVIDIDHFKSINDKYGHSVGDKTLKIIASQIKKELELEDFVARWGGEEFIVIMPHSNLQSCFERLEKLRESIAKLPFLFKGNRFTVTLSIGLADVMAYEEIEAAFEQSDKLLYKAKQSGRNQTVYESQ